MKYFSISITFVLMLSSCYVKTWQATITHKQVMDSYKNKDLIIARFGLPTSKKTEGDYEEWYFDYGTEIITDGQSRSRSIWNSDGAGSSISSTLGGVRSSNYGTSAFSNGATNTRQVVKEHKSYIKFVLKGESIINWETNGVDYSKYELIKQSIFQATE